MTRKVVRKISKILKLHNKDNKTQKERVVGTMEIKNKTSESADIYFYGDIVSSTWDRWEYEDKCPQDVVDFLNEVDNVKNINIYINSGGGSVFAGLSIYNILKRNKAYKTVYVDGLAASIASVIALAGDKVIIPKTAQFMIHKPWCGCFGDANDLRKIASDLDVAEQSILNVYEENLKDGVDISVVKDMLEKETWLTGSDASLYFNIEVSDDFEAVACTSDYFNSYKNTPYFFLNKQKTSSSSPSFNDNILKKKKLQAELDIL